MHMIIVYFEDSVQVSEKLVPIQGHLYVYFSPLDLE